MCRLIYGAIPGAADLEALSTDLVGFSPVAVAPHWPLLLPKERIGRLTKRHCDCETPLALVRRQRKQQRRAAERIERRLVRLQRGGWSWSRAGKWLQQVESVGRRPDPPADEELLGWAAWLRRAVLQVRAVPLGLLVTQDLGRVERDEPLALSDATPERLAALEEDVLYRVAP